MCLHRGLFASAFSLALEYVEEKLRRGVKFPINIVLSIVFL